MCSPLQSRSVWLGLNIKEFLLSSLMRGVRFRFEPSPAIFFGKGSHLRKATISLEMKRVNFGSKGILFGAWSLHPSIKDIIQLWLILQNNLVC